MTYRLHPIETIEGVGASRAAVLRRAGLRTTEDLLRATPGDLVRRMQRVRGFPAERMPEFQVHATLMQVDGIDGEFAEALYRAVTRTLEKLAAPHPRAIVERIRHARDRGLIPRDVDEDTALRWQKRALQIAFTQKLGGRVVDPGGNAVVGAEVRYQHERAVTDDHGEFWLPKVAYGPAEIILRAEGFRRERATLDVRPGPPPFSGFALTPGEDAPVEVDEAQGGYVGRIAWDDRAEFVDTALEALPEGARVWLDHRYRDGRVRLLGIDRRRRGQDIEVAQVLVAGERVDSDAPRAAVFVWRDGALHRSAETILEVRTRRFLGALADHLAPGGQR